MKKELCRKCRAEKGRPHTSNCEVVRHPWAFTDTTVYTPTDTGSSSSWGGSCDSSSSSDSSGGGSDCG